MEPNDRSGQMDGTQEVARGLFVAHGNGAVLLYAPGQHILNQEHSKVRIPVNVTADSGNVTGIPANVTEGRCCAF